MIPIFTGAGYRVVAPDYFGFGRSDSWASELLSAIFHKIHDNIRSGNIAPNLVHSLSDGEGVKSALDSLLGRKVR